jgi:uncharacterized damage-inducible protein DinB
MSQGGITLIPLYRGWERYQGLLTQAIGPLSPDQLAVQAAPSLRPAWVLAAHIIAGRVYWFHRVLGEGDPAIAPMQASDDDGMPSRNAAELVDGLEATWQVLQGCLQRWTPTMLDDSFVTPRGRTVTRQWVIWHVIEHDLTHGGELFLTLGMHGLPTPDL